MIRKLRDYNIRFKTDARAMSKKVLDTDKPSALVLERKSEKKHRQKLRKRRAAEKGKYQKI